MAFKPIGTPALAGATLGLVSGVSRYKQASAVAENREAVADYNNRESMLTYTQNLNSLDRQYSQLSQNSVSKNVDQQIAANQARGSVLAQSGGDTSGGTGTSLETRSVTQQAASNIARQDINTERQKAGLVSRAANEQKKAEGRVRTVPDSDVSKLAYLARAGLAGFRNVSALKALGRSLDRALPANIPDITGDTGELKGASNYDMTTRYA